MKRLFSLIFIALSALSLTACKDTGAGEKVGMITKVAKQGVFCQTWEIQIQRGGFNAGSGVNGAAFDLTIENNAALVKKAQELLNRNAEVKVTYRTEFATFCRSDSEHNAFVTGIEELKPQTTADGVMDSDHVPVQGSEQCTAYDNKGKCIATYHITDAEARAIRLRTALEPLIRELSGR